jgi:hypothetical protein
MSLNYELDLGVPELDLMMIRFSSKIGFFKVLCSLLSKYHLKYYLSRG